ncbi:Ger(x)C family spore germination protein [Paenibacillus ginsengarvi]|uniref:Ger(X)C family spore germination protein n=1 Tax=Paenibacillus ginsengarvi TaxID=400777 RepID=A0A3B0BNI4_9BACL|nr:Ger(x)C family spore germination protein [Paenibacillus ginsengarvi]RKN74945.1 Ger(x)C family spore germination protein [Paenibacillus ginsengarvi]
MRRVVYALLVGLGLSILLAGCWDIKAIQDTNYITAIGYDYKDGQYVVYAQMIDFANVSKREGGKAGEPASVWSGHESGGTVIEAMNRLYKTSQQRVFWGQVSSIVFTEEALKKGMSEFLDGLIRFREMRYTQWIYGTKEPIDRVFMMLPFFNQSPIGSILHQPEDTYRQRSYIRPLRLQKAVSIFREPGASLLLPSLGIADNTWKIKGRNDPKLMVDGMFAVSKDQQAVWFPDEDLIGLRWMDPGTKRSDVMLRSSGKPAVSISVDKPKSKIKVDIGNNGKPNFSVRVRGKIYVSEMIQQMDEPEIVRTANETIASEIEHTFARGLERGIDLYMFNHSLYRKRFQSWSKLTDSGKTPLSDLQMRLPEVKLKLIHTGMYKIKQPQNEY